MIELADFKAAHTDGSKRDYLKVQTAYANPSTVSREQVESFRQRILVGNGSRDYAIVTILAYAGLRISECLALTPEDVSLTAKEITVRCGKGDKTRVVFIGDKVVNAAREYLKNRHQGVPEEPAGFQQLLPVPQPQGRCPDPRAGQSDLQQLSIRIQELYPNNIFRVLSIASGLKS